MIFEFNWKTKYLAMAMFLLGLTAPQANSQTATAILDSHLVLIGDWVTLNLRVDHDESKSVSWPLFVDTLNQFEVLETSVVDTQKVKGLIRESQRIKLTIFDTGYFVIEPTWFKIKDKQSGAVDSLKTEALLVTVVGVPVDTANIAPIKAPIDAPLTLQEVLPYIYWGVAILVILGLLIWYFLIRKKPEPEVVARPRPKRPPHEIALKKLHELEEKKLWQQGEVKTYHSEVSEIVREYIEFRFEVPALESTTPEIVHDLTRTAVRNELQTEIRQMLELSDLVKFAKVKPLPDEHDQSLKQAYNFVNGTKPRPVAEAREAQNQEATV